MSGSPEESLNELTKSPNCKEEKEIIAIACDKDGDNLRIEKVEVFLRVYDLSKGAAKQLSKQILGFQVDGIWHTSIEIFGNEYYFQNGLVVQPAGTTHYGAHVERRSLGFTDCSLAALNEFFEASRHVWTPMAYDLFENNCNHFSDHLAFFLVEKGIPEHILSLPELVKSSPMFKQLFQPKGDRR